jgi:hypothetical protein
LTYQVDTAGGVLLPFGNTVYVSSLANGVPNTLVLYDAVYTSGSNTLTSTNATFTTNDVGKEIVLRRMRTRLSTRRRRRTA